MNIEYTAVAKYIKSQISSLKLKNKNIVKGTYYKDGFYGDLGELTLEQSIKDCMNKYGFIYVNIYPERTYEYTIIKYPEGNGNSRIEYKLIYINKYGDLVEKLYEAKNWKSYNNWDNKTKNKWVDVKIIAKFEGYSNMDKEVMINKEFLNGERKVMLRDKNINVVEVNCKITEDITVDELAEIIEDMVIQLKKNLRTKINPPNPTKKDKIRRDLISGLDDGLIAKKFDISESRVRQIKSELKKELPKQFKKG